MKNTNITLHTTQKKEYVLTGILSLPLHLETCNSIYRLSYTRVPMELEAMCA